MTTPIRPRQMPVDTTTSSVSNVVYLDGRPVARPATLAETFQQLERQPDSMARIGS